MDDESRPQGNSRRPTAEYANLSRGALCAPADAMFCRIQSTWCEQKRWEDILWTIPVDLFMRAAGGDIVIVHDQSEKPRATRAQWQGLSWLRYACRAAWDLDEEVELSRSGFDVTGFWRAAWEACSDRTKKHVAYYRAFSNGHTQIDACGCPHVDLGKQYSAGGIAERLTGVGSAGGKL